MVALKSRLENVESMTALSLLERDAESFEIRDSVTGLSRFKSGFVVDNFTGHRVGDTLHKDYEIAVDMRKNHLRPKCVIRNAHITEVATTDTARTTAELSKNRRFTHITIYRNIFCRKSICNKS